jgi:hypothetical protein
MLTPYEHGQALSEVIELTLAALERVAPTTSTQDKCCIAEAIIEGAPASASWRAEDWAVVYAGSVLGSPRYAAAQNDWLASRARAAQVAA